MSLSDAQAQRLIGAAVSISEGLVDLLNSLHRELGDDFQPLYRDADRLSDHLSDYSESRWAR